MRDREENHRSDSGQSGAELNHRRRQRAILLIDEQILDAIENHTSFRFHFDMVFQILGVNVFSYPQEARTLVDVRLQRVARHPDVFQYCEVRVYCTVDLTDLLT